MSGARLRNVGAFVRARRAGWDRLEALAARAESGRLPLAEVRELDRLYRRAAGDLAFARGAFAGPALRVGTTTRLSGDRPSPIAATSLGDTGWLALAFWASDTWSLLQPAKSALVASAAEVSRTRTNARLINAKLPATTACRKTPLVSLLRPERQRRNAADQALRHASNQ